MGSSSNPTEKLKIASLWRKIWKLRSEGGGANAYSGRVELLSTFSGLSSPYLCDVKPLESKTTYLPIWMPWFEYFGENQANWRTVHHKFGMQQYLLGSNIVVYFFLSQFLLSIYYTLIKKFIGIGQLSLLPYAQVGVSHLPKFLFMSLLKGFSLYNGGSIGSAATIYQIHE